MLELFTQTDKKLIPTLPRYTFSGRIIVVQSESEAERAVRYLRTCPLLGIDTETRPSFRRGTTHQVALLSFRHVTERSVSSFVSTSWASPTALRNFSRTKTFAKWVSHSKTTSTNSASAAPTSHREAA